MAGFEGARQLTISQREMLPGQPHYRLSADKDQEKNPALIV